MEYYYTLTLVVNWVKSNHFITVCGTVTPEEGETPALVQSRIYRDARHKVQERYLALYGRNNVVNAARYRSTEQNTAIHFWELKPNVFQ